MKNIASFLALVASLSYVIDFASGHSWVEQLTLVASNGTFVGEPGYSRGYVPRGPDFDDKLIQNMIPPAGRQNEILPADNICKKTQRTPDDQTEGSPRLRATPGAVIALRYQENGHVTIPDDIPGKPENRGYVYVYGTTDPRPDDKLLAIHKVWTDDGTGGDGRGLLLSRGDYDDGRCYQVNDKKISGDRQAKFKHEADPLMGRDIWCQQNIALPVNAPTGKPYTLYWVWDWPTAANVDESLPDGKDELYTTCMDIDIVPDNEFGSILKATEGNYIEGQDLNRAAIPEQMASLNLEIRIPDATTDDPTTCEVTQTPDVRVPHATTVAPSQTTLATSILTPKKISPAGTGNAFPYMAQPTPNDSPLINIAPSAGVVDLSERSEKYRYRAPRYVSEGDATHEEYKRLNSDGEQYESAEVNTPIYLPPRLPPHHRGRRRFFW